jgi:hypothetical protein
MQVFQDGCVDMFRFVPDPVPVDRRRGEQPEHGHVPHITLGQRGVPGRRTPDRCLNLFVFEQAVLVECPVGAASEITEVARAEVPALLAARFGIEGVTLAADGRLALGDTRAQ